ncbi:response regulator transcription factor [Cellulomonas sp.]|uniref:response regulator transcription factor n=1 Tax=Cellulomonas sp. TaxID=40001 RepID=UPI001B11B39D|nr:response regulator transcription factor [Cellulomonas sp.]MBO9553396.1 response regulator transcription factor [Cellulomonas sp.]
MTTARGLVVVAEDDPAVTSLLRLYLTRDGFGVDTYGDGAAALQAVLTRRPVALVLDVGLPGLDGIEVCRRLRASGDRTPVLFVTARDDEVDRVLGLELGADDYVTKPFSPRELVARVHAVLRRTAPADDDRLVLGGVEVDVAGRRVWADGAEVHLTALEFDLLAYLMRRPGRVLQREELLASVWGYGSAAGTRTVDVHVAQVRAKLGPGAPIRTVRGVGYAADVSAR